MPTKISVAIPVYNNAESLPMLLSQLEDFSARIKDSRGMVVECVFVDDKSLDSSLDQLTRYRPQHFEIKIFQNFRNLGQAATVQFAWSECEGDWVVTMSADLQDPVATLHDFVAKVDDDVDLVIGRRTSRVDPLPFRILSRLAVRLLSRDLTIAIDQWFDFFMMKKSVCESCLTIRGGKRFLQADVLRFAGKVAFVDYDRAQREGKTQNNLSKRWSIFFNSFIDVSSIPLKFINLASSFLSLSAVAWSALIFVNWLRNSASPRGWTPLILVMLTTSSLILLTLSLLSQYIIRIYEEMRNRPEYIRTPLLYEYPESSKSSKEEEKQ